MSDHTHTYTIAEMSGWLDGTHMCMKGLPNVREYRMIFPHSSIPKTNILYSLQQSFSMVDTILIGFRGSSFLNRKYYWVYTYDAGNWFRIHKKYTTSHRERIQLVICAECTHIDDLSNQRECDRSIHKQNGV